MMSDQHTLFLPDAQPNDGPLVGTDAILSDSPNVVEPRTAVNDPIPTPSVYTDDRGSIHNVRVGGKRINLLHTKKGVLRSGDVHANDQHDFVFRGQIELWTLESDGSTSRKVYGPGSYVIVPRFVPHVFRFLDDTVMAEWWEPGDFRAWFYEPYRTIVDASLRVAKNKADNGASRGGGGGPMPTQPSSSLLKRCTDDGENEGEPTSSDGEATADGPLGLVVYKPCVKRTDGDGSWGQRMGGTAMLLGVAATGFLVGLSIGRRSK